MKCIKCNQETGAEWKTLCYSCYKNRSTEEIREARQKKLDKKVQRLRGKAERLQKEADTKLAVMEPYWDDIAFLTQPATPTSRFGRQRSKIRARYEKGLELMREANKIKEKADWMDKTVISVKGDAEKKYQLEREQQDKVIAVGSMVYDIQYRQEAEVIKVNKKTYRLRSLDGTNWERTIDKIFVELRQFSHTPDSRK